jgi:DNA-binding CsgD family transcriptional regulator
MSTQIDLSRLTDKHINVLKLMLEDKLPKEIAGILGYEQYSIYHYVNRIYMVCDCKTRTTKELKEKFGL